MRALVTGAAGFIGSHLCQRLVEGGFDVVGVDAFTDSYPDRVKRRNVERLLSADSFHLVEGDLADLDLAGPLDGAEVVFHLAARTGVRGSWGADFAAYASDNVLGTQRVLEAAANAAPARLVVASSSSVYGDAEALPVTESAPRRPISPYGVTKSAAEDLCRAYAQRLGLPTVVLRYFTVYGPGQRPDMAFSRFIAAASAGEDITVLGDGRQSRDFTYIADAVEATVAAATRGPAGETYNVAGGSIASLLDVAGLLGELRGDPVGLRHVPVAPGEARHTEADTSKARRVLGWAPATSLDQGLRGQLAAHVEYSALSST